MPITPKDIVDKVFTKSFRGYDEEEVDLFLDEIIKEMEKQMHENSALRAKVDELTLKLGMLYASLQNQKGNMEQAQAKAQEYLNNTNIKSRLLVEQAQRKARDILAGAQKEAEARVTNATQQAQHVLREAEQEAARLQAQMEREAIGLASPNVFADMRKKQQELELLTMKIEREKADLEQLRREAGADERELPSLDFSALDIPQAEAMPPILPGDAVQSADAQDDAADAQPPKAGMTQAELLRDELLKIEPTQDAALIAQEPSPEDAQGKGEAQDTPPEPSEIETALASAAQAEKQAEEDWLADEAALMELLPPGWDNLEVLSDDELSILMKALGIPLDE